jgi:hypothetical protein
VLDNTVHGQILERTVARDARVYVTGLLVAQEERFAFWHNITSLTTAMRRALNRERTNVGRTAYTDRVKSMLLSSQSEEVAQVLATDLSNIERSTQHDGWFACTGSGGEDCRTMWPDFGNGRECQGLWEPEKKRIIIKRSELGNITSFAEPGLSMNLYLK